MFEKDTVANTELIDNPSLDELHKKQILVQYNDQQSYMPWLKSELEPRMNCQFTVVPDFQSVIKCLSDPSHPIDLVVVDIEKFKCTDLDKLNVILRTVINLASMRMGSDNRPIRIACAVSAHTSPKVLRTAMNMDILGFYPRGPAYSIDDRANAIVQMMNGNPFIPDWVLERIRVTETASTFAIHWYSPQTPAAVARCFAEKLVTDLPITLTSSSTFGELIQRINDASVQINVISIDIDELKLDQVNLIKSLRTFINLCSYRTSNGTLEKRKVRIGVACGINSDLGQIREILKNSDVDTLIPRGGDDFNYQEVSEGIAASCRGEYHIPKRLRVKLNLPITTSEALIDDGRKRVTIISNDTPDAQVVNIAKRLVDALPFSFVRTQSIKEIMSLLYNPSFSTDYICLDVDYIDINDGNVLDVAQSLVTLLNCTSSGVEKPPIKLVALVSEKTDPGLVRELIRFKPIEHLVVRANANVDFEQIKNSWENIASSKAEISPVIKAWIKPKSNNKKSIEDQMALTERQQQILDLIVSKGASNKNIARILKISESTVKLHIGHVLKKFGLTNRTQLALFTNTKSSSNEQVG